MTENLFGVKTSKPKKKWKRPGCGYRLKEYCSETSLHGPKYITEDGGSIFQR